jgi:hypothetical protein
LDANTFDDIEMPLLTGLFDILVLIFSPTRTTKQKKTTSFCRGPHDGLFWPEAQAAARKGQRCYLAAATYIRGTASMDVI